MKRNGSANRLHTEDGGGVLIEFTVVFPVLLLVVLGVVEVSLLMLDWSAGTRATYRGARVAIVNDPVAVGAQFAKSQYTTMTTKAGNYCMTDLGATNTASACPVVNITCTGAASNSGSCTSGTFNNTSFNKIFSAVQSQYPGRTLDRAQLQVTYATNGTGFVGRESFNGSYGELPMNVTVSLRCMRHQFYFIGGLLRWTFPASTGCNDVTLGPRTGLLMPNFYTTLPSESLYTF